MIRIQGIKLPYNHNENAIAEKVASTLRISKEDACGYRIAKKSIDARKKPQLFYVYTVDISLAQEKKIVNKCKNKNVSLVTPKSYVFPNAGTTKLSHRPVIVGSGPAGLFCTYMLAKAGYRPIMIERGAPIRERMQDVAHFWNTGELNTESNVQFGEGGAGTFSDGKLNTSVKDPMGRNRKVLETFVAHGAPEDILYVNKPHIGTDILAEIMVSMREEIIKYGGEIKFHTKLTNLQSDANRVSSVTVISDAKEETWDTEALVLALGHSARDTFQMLYDKSIPMESKAFAVGVRVEHPQKMIDVTQYGMEWDEFLPACAYKLTAQLEDGRGVYSFCMCPGGYVVNASSEEGHLAVNGMSYHARDGKNANSAIVVTIPTSDFESDHPLSGLAYQRKLEARAYEIGQGRIPVQRLEDFRENKIGTCGDLTTPQMKGAYTFANLRGIFTDEISHAIIEGMEYFDQKIKGFGSPDTLLSGVESRTSSPIRIPRNDNMECEIGGIYPCGEGAGYAGGITSAAIDGIKTAEKIAQKYAPFDTLKFD